MIIDDLPRTVGFYRDVLGFDLVAPSPDVPGRSWALLRRGGAELMFHAPEALPVSAAAVHRRRAAPALTYYLDVDDVETYYGELRRRVDVVHALHETAYGTREFSVYDCNGFLLTFAEALPSVLRAA